MTMEGYSDLSPVSGPEWNHNNTTEMMTLAEASKRMPRVNGKRINVSTIFRWTRGLRGVHLQYWRIGRKIVTTERALKQFFAALAAADSAPVQNPPAKRKRRPRSGHRQASIDEANAILRNAGILV